MNKKITVVQVGCGSISKTWLQVLTSSDDVLYVGLVDINIDMAISKKNEFHLTCDVFTNFKEAIDLLKPDLVIDTTIPKIHHQVVTYALKSGCHVFGEKPLSDSIINAIDMVKTADKMNKYYSIMQNRRYINNISDFSSIITDKKIGDLGSLNAAFYIEAHFGGFRDIMESPLILDMAIHTFDQARYISKCDPISVYCHEFNPKGSWYKGSASATCIFEMTNNVVFTYNGSWCAKGALTSWECNWRVMGNLGAAIWDGKTRPFYEIVSSNDKTSMFPNNYDQLYLETKENKAEYHQGCIDEMISSLKANKPSATDCHDNIKSLAMVMGAIKSSKENRKVLISELL